MGWTRVNRPAVGPPARAAMLDLVRDMYLRILSHPVFVNLNFHMPMIVDLSHPLIMLEGENGSGKSTLLHSIYHALRGDEVPSYAYRVDEQGTEVGTVVIFDAEQHNPRNNPELLADNPRMQEFVETASHGQVMLSLFQGTFPSLPNGSVLLLDEPEMALSASNQRRILKMLKELVDTKDFRIIAATHSPHLLSAPETYVINLDRHVNRNVTTAPLGMEGASTIQ